MPNDGIPDLLDDIFKTALGKNIVQELGSARSMSNLATISSLKSRKA
jgi:hypothetical protein